MPSSHLLSVKRITVPSLMLYAYISPYKLTCRSEGPLITPHSYTTFVCRYQSRANIPRGRSCCSWLAGRKLSWKETAETFHTSWEKVCDAVE